MYFDSIHGNAFLSHEPSPEARFREEYYTHREQPKKAAGRPSQERGLAVVLRARTIMSVGRFFPLI